MRNREWIDALPDRRERIQGALKGLLAAGVAAPAGDLRQRAGAQALIVLESLQRHGRLVSPEVRGQIAEWRCTQPSVTATTAAELFARMLPLMQWLRGEPHRLLEASAKLMLDEEEDDAAKFAFGVWVMWLRYLYWRPDPERTWEWSLGAVQESADEEWLPDWVVRALLDGPKPEHPRVPAVRLLWRARCCLDGAQDCASALARTQDAQEQTMVAMLAGLIWGGDAVAQALDVLPARLQSWTAMLDQVSHRACEFPVLDRPADITSETHPLPVRGVPVVGGWLSISPFPGESASVHGDGSRIYRSLASDLTRLREAGCTDVVSLLSPDEFIDHQVMGMRRDVEALGMDWLHLPPVLLGMDCEWSRGEVRTAARQVADLVRRGRHPVLHGIIPFDAPTLFAIAVLEQLDVPRDVAARLVGDVCRQIDMTLAACCHDE